MQRYFSDIASSILENINHLISNCRKKGIPVIFTRHGHIDPAKDAGMLFEWWSNSIIEGTDAHRFINGLLKEPDDVVIKKMRYSAFYQTDLDRILKKKGIHDIIITGVMTNLCCETTARDAFVRDYRVHFMIDATAASDPALHESTLKNLAYGFAYLHECGELIHYMISLG